jgi:hypothetical protein
LKLQLLFVSIQLVEDRSEPFGNFTSDVNSKSLDCGNGHGALTHKDDSTKSSAGGVWMAPPEWEGNIYFFVTVAVTKDMYWVGLQGRNNRKAKGLLITFLFCVIEGFARSLQSVF